jgi:hypothetical protein
MIKKKKICTFFNPTSTTNVNYLFLIYGREWVKIIQPSKKLWAVCLLLVWHRANSFVGAIWVNFDHVWKLSEIVWQNRGAQNFHFNYCNVWYGINTKSKQKSGFVCEKCRQLHILSDFILLQSQGLIICLSIVCLNLSKMQIYTKTSSATATTADIRSIFSIRQTLPLLVYTEKWSYFKKFAGHAKKTRFLCLIKSGEISEWLMETVKFISEASFYYQSQTFWCQAKLFLWRSVIHLSKER